MAIEDHAAGRWAVQFHPESILSAHGDAGRLVIANVLRLCRAHQLAPLDTTSAVNSNGGFSNTWLRAN